MLIFDKEKRILAMTTFERIKELAKSQGLTLARLNEKAGLGTNSIYHWKTKTPSTDSLQKVAKVLNVSVDYLLGKDEHKDHYYDLTDKEKNDIGIQAEKLMKGIESGHDLNFYGEPDTEEQKNRLLIAVQTAMEMNKKEAKKKFTPKKYRK